MDKSADKSETFSLWTSSQEVMNKSVPLSWAHKYAFAHLLKSQ